MGSPALFSCVPCRLAWETKLEQYAHMKTDFHCHNLKRVVAGIEPLLASQYDQLCDQPLTFSDVPGEKFGRREKQMERKNNKLNKLRERQSLKFMRRDDAETITEDDSELDGVDFLIVSLFDESISENFDENLRHMRYRYGFYLPCKQYGIDEKAFHKYLCKLVYVDFECLHCRRKFREVLAVQHHMRDQGHHRVDSSVFRDFALTIESSVNTMQDFDFSDLTMKDNNVVLTSKKKEVQNPRLSELKMHLNTVNSELKLTNPRSTVNNHFGVIMKSNTILNHSELKELSRDLKKMQRIQNKTGLNLAVKKNSLTHNITRQNKIYT